MNKTKKPASNAWGFFKNAFWLIALTSVKNIYILGAKHKL